MAGGVRILVVDDDPGMTETLADILRDMGYDVAVAGDGYRALEMAGEKSFDLALLDIRMPGLNGVETLRELKRANPSIKVLMMTAYSKDDLVLEARDGGAEDVVQKPLDIEGLLKFIEERTGSVE